MACYVIGRNLKKMISWVSKVNVSAIQESKGIIVPDNIFRLSIQTWLRKSGRFFYPLVLFCLLLAWFYLGSSWYPTATLFASGTVPDVSSQISIQWDSGKSLNGYEWERYSLQALSLVQEKEGIPVIITRTGEYNSASLGPKVVLRNIFVDGQHYIPSPEQIAPGIEFTDGKFIFHTNGAALKLFVHPKSHLRFEFPLFNSAGKVDARIDEKSTRYDLYSPINESQWGGRYAKIVDLWFVTADGEFTVSMPMPRYPIQSLRIRSKGGASSVSSVVVKTEDGKIIDVENGVVSHKGIDYPMVEVDRQLKRHYHPDRFLFQILFALLTTGLLVRLYLFATRFQSAKDCFFNEQRYLFWLMLVSSCLLFLFWHISFWPGVMSNDSLEIWRAAQIPGMYLGDHPPLNVVFYLYLNQLWNNVAIVPFVQNFLTSLLIAHIFFSLYRKGLALYCLLPCYALITFSLPVGLYTIILWKDVPFALIVVLVGFKLACLYFDKRLNILNVTWKEWFVLFFLTLLLAGFRHNGVLYLFLVPFIILLFGLVRLRPLLLGVFFLMTILGGAAFFLSPGGSGTSNYLSSQTKTYLTQSLNQLSFAFFQKSGENYLGIFDVNQKKMQWDLVHLCMYGRYTNDFLRNVRWNDAYSYLPPPANKVMKKMQGIAWALYWRSYQVPWVYFSWNPVYMLILYPLLPLFFRRIPMTAVFSLFVFIPVAVLVFLQIFNWRYYYFAHFASYFIFPMIVTDLYGKKVVTFRMEKNSGKN